MGLACDRRPGWRGARRVGALVLAALVVAALVLAALWRLRDYDGFRERGLERHPGFLDAVRDSIAGWGIL